MVFDVEIKGHDGRLLGKILANEKTFSSGSRGFFGQAKMEIEGKRYQVQIQMVEIGSKEKKESE